MVCGELDDMSKANFQVDPVEAKKWLDPYQPCNVGIFASYLAVGFGIYFLNTPLAFYMVDVLSASPQKQAVVTGLQSLPWALKILCGFVTDSFPIMGLRRKPYFFIGWGIYILCNVILAIIGNPNIGQLAIFIFLMIMGFVQADVCTDAMIVERSKSYETTETRGILQATGYIIRFFGGIVGAALGAVLYNKDSWGWGLSMRTIFLINGAVPAAIVIPFFYALVEIRAETPPNIKTQCASIWRLVQRRAVWKPCSFIFIYNALLLTNPAWNSFLVNGLEFSNFDIGLLALAGTILSYFALVVYKKYLFNSSWRLIYVVATGVAFFFTILQLVLVFGLNEKIGMGSEAGELFFAMGSSGVVAFAQAIQFLPACRMFLAMCPEGAEGASYAMLTTLSNLAGTLSVSISGSFANIWDVSNETLAAHDYGGLWRLTLLCGCIMTTGLLFIQLLPSGVEEQLQLQESDYSSKTAGTVFVIILSMSLSYIVIYTIVTII